MFFVLIVLFIDNILYQKAIRKPEFIFMRLDKGYQSYKRQILLERIFRQLGGINNDEYVKLLLHKEVYWQKKGFYITSSVNINYRSYIFRMKKDERIFITDMRRFLHK
ncbi:hypothetical protein DMUE_3951 [Dictyocoela muelleri]|nr:hypothetical protein DMUE_3951 [Dictyocoela muelleri]